MKTGDIVIIKKPRSPFHNHFATFLSHTYADGVKLDTIVAFHTPIRKHVAFRQREVLPLTLVEEGFNNGTDD